MTEIPESEARYLSAALQAARVARQFLEWMERAAEQLAPQRSTALAAEAERTFAEPVRALRAALDVSPPPVELAPFASRFAEAVADIEKAFELFTTFPSVFPPESIGRILGALHHCAQAQETFYLLRHALSPFAGYWQLPDVSPVDDAPEHAGNERTGITHVTKGGYHGGFSLYVPEHYSAEHEWPLIVALHGGSGNGRDFLWTWVREAKSLGYLLVAPTAVHDTWSEDDDPGLLQILAWLSGRYRLAAGGILLTGLSDGATFTLLYGLARPQVYRALAPLCGVLHPANEVIGNLQRARGVPIYLVHGALDFLFPIQLARMARDTLSDAGAALEYRELPELSHTYPRSENVRILRWFEALRAADAK